MRVKPLSSTEIKKLETWLQKKDDDLPSEITQLLSKLLKIYHLLTPLLETNRSLSDRLKESMGIKPKSERGSQLNQPRGVGR